MISFIQHIEKQECVSINFKFLLENSYFFLEPEYEPKEMYFMEKIFSKKIIIKAYTQIYLSKYLYNKCMEIAKENPNNIQIFKLIKDCDG